MIIMKEGKSKGQVWIETVMYTLIAFAIMGLVLAYAKPKIEELQDKAIIDQSILMLKDIDSTLLTMGGAGNQRVIEISVKKGDFIIDGKKDQLVFEMQSRLEYSEPDKTINDGNVEISTTKSGKFNVITLAIKYYNYYNITNAKRDENKTISQAPVAYTLKISDLGTETFTDLTQCPANPCSLPLFNGECVDSYCQYTSKRPTINFEIL
jgi:hypothetical protein